MLPLLFTRKYLLDRWAERRANTSQAMIYSAENNLYVVRRVDTAAVPASAEAAARRLVVARKLRRVVVGCGSLIAPSFRNHVGSQLG